ncbi:hypothetical protein TVAG_530470, partial [Trichomonas vaginalis G3]
MLNAIKGLVNNLSPEDKKGMLDMFGIKMPKKAKDITNKLALAIKNQGGTGSVADIFKNAKSFYDDYNGIMNVPASNSPVALDHDQRSHNRALMEMQPIYSDPPPKIDESELAYKEIQNAFYVVKNINGQKLPDEKWLDPITKAGERFIMFNIDQYSPRGKDYFNKMFPRVMAKFIGQIDLFKQKWTFYYDFDEKRNIL